MLQASQSPSPSPAASFFARLNGTAQAPHPRSLSVSAADAPTSTGHDNNGGGEGSGGASDSSTGRPAGVSGFGVDRRPSPAIAGSGADLRRAVSMRNPARPTVMTGAMPSFAAAGEGLASPALSASSHTFTPPAAASHPLFSHHALPRTLTMSDPGHDDEALLDSPPSPSGSTLSSGAFSPASAFLSFFSGASPREELAPDAQGARVLDYTLGKIIGRGGFSTVRQATHVRTGEVIACKIVKRDDLSDSSGSLERFEDEIRIWKDLPHHPSLLELLDMHRSSYATFLFMPFLGGGSLLEVLQREGGSEKTARKWFPSVVIAVAALHEGFNGFSGGMLHGDLKLDNFIADTDGRLKLGDFGMAQIVSMAPPPLPKPKLPSHLQVGRPRMSSAPTVTARGGRQPSRSPARRRETLAGPGDVCPHPSQPFPSASLPYAPPELLCAPPSAPSLKQDIWAVGIILHALLTGRLPFIDSFDPRLQMKILRGQWDEPTHLGHEWLEALHGCMDRELATRWDIRRVRESDAVTGWREVKPRLKSRSRSRARHPIDSSGLPEPIPIRGRDHSRGRMHHAGSVGSLRGASSSYTGSASELLATPEGAVERLAAERLYDGQDTFNESRSRSRSRPRIRRPLSINVADLSRLTPTGDQLSAEFENVSITRGRSKTRLFTEEPRTSSAGHLQSLNAPGDGLGMDERPSAARPASYHGPVDTEGLPRERSRTRADGVQVPVPGSGVPSLHHHHPHPHHHQHQHHSAVSSPVVTGTPSKGTRSRGSPGWGESRPPTLGSELDAVHEEGRGRRGRSPQTRGRGMRSLSRKREA